MSIVCKFADPMTESLNMIYDQTISLAAVELAVKSTDHVCVQIRCVCFVEWYGTITGTIWPSIMKLKIIIRQ